MWLDTSGAVRFFRLWLVRVEGELGKSLLSVIAFGMSPLHFILFYEAEAGALAPKVAAPEEVAPGDATPEEVAPWEMDSEDIVFEYFVYSIV